MNPFGRYSEALARLSGDSFSELSSSGGVMRLLDSPTFSVRCAAVIAGVLTDQLSMTRAFIEKALSTIDSKVIIEMGDFFFNSKKKEVGLFLRNVVQNESFHAVDRNLAYWAILNVRFGFSSNAVPQAVECAKSLKANGTVPLVAFDEDLLNLIDKWDSV